ncbi:MAG: ABC transporter ATP-binding protein [Pseudomonadota bacterium]
MRLEARDLSVRLGRSLIVEGASLALAPGSVTAVIGPNGAGKSTLLRALAGLIPSDGTLSLDGRAASGATLRESVAYMPQDTSPTSSLTLVEVVLLGRVRTLGVRVPDELLAEAESALARFGLTPLADRTLGAVSGGQRQLTLLAQALFRHPSVLLLDEPTAALDLRHQLVVLDTICRAARESGIAVAIAIHDLTLAARFADQIICLSAGRIEVTGPPAAVISHTLLKDVYGVEAEIAANDAGRLTIAPVRAL